MKTTLCFYNYQTVLLAQMKQLSLKTQIKVN